MTNFTEREIAAVREATIESYLADLRRSYPETHEEIINRAALAIYELYTQAIRDGGITRDHAVNAAELVHDIVDGDGRDAQANPLRIRLSGPGEPALLTALAALAGRSDRLIVGLVPAGQARLQRVSTSAPDDVVRRLEAIYRRDRTRLVEIAAARLRIRDRAEDVVHQAYSRVAVQAADSDSRRRIGHPEAYLATAVLREVGRTSQQEQLAAGDIEPLTEGITNEALLGALARLPSSQRDGVILRHVYGFAIAETAARLNTSPTLVTSAVNKAVQNLRQLLYDDQR